MVDQLWSTALRIEEGDLPEAERAVKAAQDALMQALKEGATPEEIKRLVDELRSALSRYLQALASQQQDKGNMSPQGQQDGDQLVSQQDLDKMLKNIEKLAQSGSKDMAEHMLSELKDILDRLQTGNFAENAQQQRASRMMKDLSDIVSKQQKLLDDTFTAKRQQGAANGDSQEFEVSPPGQPMEFGPGMSMAPLFEEMPGEAQQGSDEGTRRVRRSRQPAPGSARLEHRSQPQGQPSGQNRQLADRQQELRDQLQSLIDRFRIEGGDAPHEFEGAQEAMERGQGRARRRQSRAARRSRKASRSTACAKARSPWPSR